MGLSLTMPFTKDDVVAAFKELKKKGIKPIQNSFKELDGNGNICKVCAITAVLMNRKMINEESSMKGYDTILGVTNSTMWSFIEGFDNTRFGEVPEEPNREAYDLGVECREALFE